MAVRGALPATRRARRCQPPVASPHGHRPPHTGAHSDHSGIQASVPDASASRPPRARGLATCTRTGASLRPCGPQGPAPRPPDALFLDHRPSPRVFPTGWTRLILPTWCGEAGPSDEVAKPPFLERSPFPQRVRPEEAPYPTRDEAAHSGGEQGPGT